MGLFDQLMEANPQPVLVPEIKPDTPHYEAVGRFVTSFATAEAAVHMLARHISGLSDQKARIVFGGMRLPDLSEIIRQITRIDSLVTNIQAEIEACLTQIGLIAKRRHMIVHRSSNFFDGKLLVTNVLTTKSLKSTESEVFEIQEMSDMQSDCMRIYLRLAKIFSPEKHRDQRKPLVESFVYGEWRYKPVPPKTPNLTSRTTVAKKKRQLPASPEK